MTSQPVRKQLAIQNENSNIIANKTMTGEEGKNTKLPLGKVGSGLGSRKALGDITNKPKITKEELARKKISVKGKLNVLEERFLHDHKKCIQAPQSMSELMFLDLVLPEHGPMPSDFSVSDSSKIKHKKLSCYPEPVELPVPKISDRLEYTPKLDLTLDLESPPCSPQSWKFEEVEFFFKPESEV